MRKVESEEYTSDVLTKKQENSKIYLRYHMTSDVIRLEFGGRKKKENYNESMKEDFDDG